MEKSYTEQRDIKTIQRTREILEELPPWFREFIRGIESETLPLTRLNYSYDGRVFLHFLLREHPLFSGYPLRDIPVSLMEKLELADLEQYLEYLGYYLTEEDREFENGDHGKARKVASLRALFKYLQKRGLIQKNPTILLSTPKINQKEIIYLSPDEVAKLIDIVESGEGLSEAQLRYHKRTVKRDVAILVLFLTTGIRVSELVGLNIGDVDLENLSFRVTRKGGDRTILYFNYETEKVLSEYLDARKAEGTYALSAPLFLSYKKERIRVRSVENLVKKYAKLAAPLKHITPHKLRSTYGTTLYQETGDIYLVADVLGHKDVNTTRKHYAAISEANRRRAAKTIKLRDDD